MKRLIKTESLRESVVGAHTYSSPIVELSHREICFITGGYNCLMGIGLWVGVIGAISSGLGAIPLFVGLCRIRSGRSYSAADAWISDPSGKLLAGVNVEDTTKLPLHCGLLLCVPGVASAIAGSVMYLVGRNSNSTYP